MKKIVTSALIAGALTAGSPAFANVATAWTGGFSISSLYVSGEGNYHFRITGIPAGVGCPNGFAYLNQADSGSKEYFSVLELAYALGKQVNVYLVPDNQGFCHIAEVATAN